MKTPLSDQFGGMMRALPRATGLALLAALCAVSGLLAQQGASDAKAAIERGVNALNAGRFAQAEAALREAVRTDPANAHAWKALGVVFAAQGLHDLSSEPFEKACRLNPREPDACYYLARNHYLLNRFEESLELFDRLTKASGNDWRYENGRGLALLALSRYPAAEQAFELAMKRETGQASLEEKPAINLGSLYSRAGEPEKARAVLLRVVQQFPAAARAWFELAKVQVQLEELKLAKQSLEAALRAKPAYAEAHLLLAKVLNRLGEPEKASEHRRQGLRQPN